MPIDFSNLVKHAVDLAFLAAGALVKAATYYRPASFNPVTGQTASAEASAAVNALVAQYRPLELGTVVIQPGDEKVLVRASELAGISNPVAGDYLLEQGSGLRRDVLSARLDATGQLWVFQTTRSLNEDWGDLTAFTASEDWGDLTGATDFEDRGALV